jgi:ubiquinone/menaquinone biosynthesis C-methylase UbiE
MTTVSAYNECRTFMYNWKESRLLKCARLIRSLTPGTMLDIGCCKGDWALYWGQQGWQPTGIDINRRDVTVAQERGLEARVCDLNAERLPFPDASFDLIFAGEVIEHLVDTDGFVAELSRCTKRGGHVIITTPNLVSFENRVRILFGVYPAWVNYSLQGSGHVRAYTASVLKKQMSWFGLKVTHHTGNWVPVIPQGIVNDINIPWFRFTGDLLPSLSQTLIVMAEKV